MEDELDEYGLNPKENADPSIIKQLLMDPREVVKGLDRLVVGQEEAKKALALMMFNRGIQRLIDKGALYMSRSLQKSNVLLIGPTGCGKNSLIKALTEVTGLPISINDMTAITAAGYVGGKIEDIIINHVKLCKEWLGSNQKRWEEYGIMYTNNHEIDVLREMVECGVIFIDEVDKICARGLDRDSKDINGDMIQNELLRCLEEGIIDLNGRASEKGRSGSPGLGFVNTKNITFVLGGAFSGLSDVVYNRLNKHNSMGFNSNITNRLSKELQTDLLLQQVTTDDLIEYGFKPEFLGRIPKWSVLHPLTVETLELIITEPQDSILQEYKELFKVFHINLEVEHEAVKEIATEAYKLNTGARSLKTLFRHVLNDSLYNMFDLVGTTVTITKEIVQEKCT